MPRYPLTLPDGKTYPLDVPDGWSQDQITKAAEEATQHLMGQQSAAPVATPTPGVVPEQLPKIAFKGELPTQQEPDNGGHPYLATAARVLGPIAGGALGAAATPVIGPFGATLGAGAGGALGENVAEHLEGTKPSLGRAAVAGGLSMIPMGKAAATLPRTILKRALGGAGLSAFGTELTGATEGRQPSAGDLATNTLIGAGLGTVGGAAENLIPRIPGVKQTVAAAKYFKDRLREAVSPTSMGPRAEEGAMALTKYMSGVSQDVQRMQKAVNDVGRRTATLTPYEYDTFMDRAQAAESNFIFGKEGEPLTRIARQETPELQAIQDAAQMLVGREGRLLHETGRKHGLDLLGEFYVNHMPHIWKNARGETATVIPAYVQKRMTGSMAPVQHRTFDTYTAARAEGFEPMYTNPLEVALIRGTQMARLRHEIEMLGELKRTGGIEWGMRPSPGYRRVNDRMLKLLPKEGEAISKPEYDTGPAAAKASVWPNTGKTFDELETLRKGSPYTGEWFVHEDIARLMDRHFSPGWRRSVQAQGAAVPGSSALLTPEGTPITPYEFIRKVNNDATSWRLGLSAFHLNTTAFNNAWDHATQVLENAVRRNFKGALKHLPGVVPGYGMVKDWQMGQRMFTEYLNGTNADPELRQAVNAFLDSGGDPHSYQEFVNNHATAFGEALRNHSPVGTVWHGASAIPEYFAKLMFENLIPKVKMGAFARRFQDAMDRLGPNASSFAKAQAAYKIGNEIDNVFGQLNYNKLFWDNKYKQAVQAMFQAPGWAIGTFRQLGGGIADVVSGKGLTNRAASVLTLPVLAIGYSLLAEFLFTLGKPKIDTAEDLKAHAFGGFIHGYDAKGQPQRSWLPTYQKDMFHVWQGLGEAVGQGNSKAIMDYATAKLSPLAEAVVNIARNEAFVSGKGKTQLRDPNDPWYTQMKDIAMQTARTLLTPFSYENYQRAVAQPGQEQGLDQTTAKLIALNLGGFSTAPRALTLTPAERQLDAIMAQRRGDVPPPRQVVERRADKRAIQAAVGEGRPIDLAQAAKLSPNELKAAVRVGAMQDYRRKLEQGRLTLPELLGLYSVSNEEQKKVAAGVISKRLVAGNWIQTVPREQLPQLQGQIAGFLNDVRERGKQTQAQPTTTDAPVP